MAKAQSAAASARPAASKQDPASWLPRYERMLLIRHFESEIQRLFLRGEVHGTTHLSTGQEAVPVGVCSALESDDWFAGTYRGHGHALAKGTDPEALAAEMLGRATGMCGGRAGLDERDRPRAPAGRLLRHRRAAASPPPPARRVTRGRARAAWRPPSSATAP